MRVGRRYLRITSQGEQVQHGFHSCFISIYLDGKLRQVARGSYWRWFLGKVTLSASRELGIILTFDVLYSFSIHDTFWWCAMQRRNWPTRWRIVKSKCSLDRQIEGSPGINIPTGVSRKTEVYSSAFRDNSKKHSPPSSCWVLFGPTEFIFQELCLKNIHLIPWFSIDLNWLVIHR